MTILTVKDKLQLLARQLGCELASSLQISYWTCDKILSQNWGVICLSLYLLNRCFKINGGVTFGMSFSSLMSSTDSIHVDQHSKLQPFWSPWRVNKSFGNKMLQVHIRRQFDD